MNDNKFVLKLKDHNLTDPESKKEYNARLFTEVSKQYDRATIFLSFGRDRAWKKLFFRLLPPLRSPSVLDLACGTGDITLRLSELYPDGNITGLDLNSDMVDVARKKIDHQRISFVIKDMTTTGYDDESFDLVTGSYALRNAPDLSAALDEICRVMKKGGSGLFLDFSRSKNKILTYLQYLLLKIWGNIWGLVLHGNPEVYGYIAESLLRFPDRKDLEKLLDKKGFHNIKTRLLFFGYIAIVSFERPSGI
jgi:demethylmenaquinone methyltransferase/2-methoxy-6-polyprenyl-1,4-benzoquinol methylase